MHRRLLYATLLGLFAITCAEVHIPVAHVPPPSPPTGESRARDQAAFEARFKPFLPRIGEIRSASILLVESHRAPGNSGFHGYPIRAQTTLPQAQAEQLAELLDLASTYSPEGAGCYSPGAALTLTGEGGSFDLVICLHCQYIDLQPDDDYEHLRPLSDQGTRLLLDVFRRAFPEQSSELTKYGG